MSKILITEDYNLFKRMKGNRTVNKGQVKKLYDSIAENPSVISATPIIVNEANEIIDGQHRYEALKKLGLPIYYTVVEGLGLGDIQIINSSTKTWSPVDYAKSFAEMGNDNYGTYLEFKRKYHLNHSVLLVYLTGLTRNVQRNTVVSFRKGKFVVGDKELAHKLCQYLMEVGQYYKKYATRSFALAFQKIAIHPEYDQDRMIGKLKQYNEMLKDSAYPEEYMRQLEKVYNHHCWGDVGRIKLF